MQAIRDAPMDQALREHQTYLSQPSWGNRLVSFLLAAAVTLLIALLMLAMGALGPGEKAKTPTNLVAVQIPPERSGSKTTHVHTVTRQAAAAPHPQHAVTQAPVIKPPVPVTPFLHLSKEDFAASDISKLPSHAGEGSASTSGSGSSSTYGPGEGPGGAHLYNAEWYREPSRAELSTYLSQTRGEGDWATIACKTIEHYHVENCQELDESPPGSGLARALRQASWQFLVRPPRVDGHILIGSWVRIRFTFTKVPTGEPLAPALPGADDGN